MVAILQQDEETANKYLSVVQFTITMNQLLRLFATELGVKEEEFTVQNDANTCKESVLQRSHVTWPYSLASTIAV